MIQHNEIPRSLFSVLEMLLQAYDYASDGDHWMYAVEMDHLHTIGATVNDLRWLAQVGVVEHAQEVTAPGYDGREFCKTGNMTLSPRSCFVLTDDGLHLARHLRCRMKDVQSAALTAERLTDVAQRSAITRASKPHWDAAQRQLWFASAIVKQFRWKAQNQERILLAFQEDGWPRVIDDPLCPAPGQDPKRRLHDTIKGLNRNQQNRLVSFHGNGDGQTIRWNRTTGREGAAIARCTRPDREQADVLDTCDHRSELDSPR